MTRIFLNKDVVVIADFHIRTFGTMSYLSLARTITDGAFFETAFLFASKALGLVEKPSKALNKFRKRETLVSEEAMSPPVYGELFDIVPYLGESFYKICPI